MRIPAWSGSKNRRAQQRRQVFAVVSRVSSLAHPTSYWTAARLPASVVGGVLFAARDFRQDAPGIALRIVGPPAETDS
jgi:hypothetical protein